MSDQSSESGYRVSSESVVSQCQLSSESRTDGRTDGLTKNHSPSDTNSRNPTPAGGQNESTPSQPVSDLSVPASQPNPSSEPKVTVTGVDGVTRIVQGVEDELPDGVEYTFGPCDTCGEMFCEHERVSQPVVSSSRAVDLDLDRIEARANAATPGPWDVGPYGTSFTSRHVGRIVLAPMIAPASFDAEFIAHAREDVPRLVAEVRRLRERNRWLEQRFIDQAHTLHAERRNELLDSLEAVRAERDAARAEADDLRQAYRTVCDYAEQHDATRAELNEARAEVERLRERIEGQAETISKLGQVAAESGRVMEALSAHGPSIVPHLMDTDDNAGERLRELLREVSEWALNGTTASTPLRAEIERLREAWRGESEHGHSTEACCSCCYQVNAERAEAARVREALQAAERKVRAVELLHVWTNGDGKRFVFADDLGSALEIPGYDAALDGAE